MENLLNRYEKHFGYKATAQELYALYTQGELELNEADENTLLAAMRDEVNRRTMDAQIRVAL